MSSVEIFPLGDQLGARAPEERFNEQVYRTIPALDDLAQAAARIGNKLSQEARDSLFYGAEKFTPEVRALKIEVSLLQLKNRETVQPDLEYFNGLAPRSKKDFANEQKDNDEWLTPPSP